MCMTGLFDFIQWLGFQTLSQHRNLGTHGLDFRSPQQRRVRAGCLSRTCASVSLQLSSGTVGVDGGHLDVVGRIGIQVLQDQVVHVSLDRCLGSAKECRLVSE